MFLAALTTMLVALNCWRRLPFSGVFTPVCSPGALHPSITPTSPRPTRVYPTQSPSLRPARDCAYPEATITSQTSQPSGVQAVTMLFMPPVSIPRHIAPTSTRIYICSSYMLCLSSYQSRNKPKTVLVLEFERERVTSTQAT